MRFPQKTAALLFKSMKLTWFAAAYIEPLLQLDKLSVKTVVLIPLPSEIDHTLWYSWYFDSLERGKFNVGITASASRIDFPDTQALNHYLAENWQLYRSELVLSTHSYTSKLTDRTIHFQVQCPPGIPDSSPNLELRVTLLD